MREKPVPVRVGKELQPETSMDAIEEGNFEKETNENASEDAAVSKELPSMVSVIPLNSSNESPSKYNTRLYQTAIEYRPSLDIPGEFEFLNSDSVSESQKQAVKFGVRVFRDWLNKQGVQFQSLEDMSRREIANSLEQFYLTARRPNGTQYKKNTLKSIKHSLDHYLRASSFKKDFSISTDYDFRQALKYRSVTDIVRPIREIVRPRKKRTGHSVRPTVLMSDQTLTLSDVNLPRKCLSELLCGPLSLTAEPGIRLTSRIVNKTLDNLPEDADLNRFPQFTKEIILKLYQSGQLGLTTTDNPSIIIQTVWFYIVAYFFTNIDKRLLRELKESNLILAKDEDGREYYWLDYKPPERIRGEVHKSRIYARPGSLCCPIAIIKKYMEHRNPRNDVLFQHPKRISHLVWYSPLPLGKNKHTDLMKSMCLNAGVDPPLTGRCIRSYVQELLQDCDQTVNDMFRVEGPATPITMHGVLVPKYPGDTDPSLVPPFILSVPRLSSPTLSTSTSGTIQSNHVNIQPHITTMSSNHIANHVATMVANQHTNNASNHSTTQGNHVTTTQHGRHLTIHGNHIITNPPGISPITTVASFPNGIMLPYPNTFPTLNDFAKPKESYNGSEISTSHYGTKGPRHELSYHRNGTSYNSSQTSTAHYGTTAPSNESINHHNGTSVDTSSGTNPPQLTVGKSTIFAVSLQPPNNQQSTSTEPSDQTTTVEISTQTEPANKQWLESTYYKADLKTRNKMRLQARKSLLCFLEELNEISDGHGTELFYEIVQEDMNMWKSITNSSKKI